MDYLKKSNTPKTNNSPTPELIERTDLWLPEVRFRRWAEWVKVKRYKLPVLK